jgi:hypothetical protein
MFSMFYPDFFEFYDNFMLFSLIDGVIPAELGVKGFVR